MHPSIIRAINQNEDESITNILHDSKYTGIGNANNQLKKPDGSKIEVHAPEDRTLARVLKKDEIYAYAIFDGFNGHTVVDYAQNYILVNIFLDYLEALNSSSEDIYSILKSLIEMTDKTFEQNCKDDLALRTSLVCDMDGANRMAKDKEEELKKLDEKLSCGAFVTLAILIKKRLFVINVGTVHCFMVKVAYENKDIAINTFQLTVDHSISNEDEMLRLKQLNASVELLRENQEFHRYTRCLGDFKTKMYFNETNKFKNCNSSPILCEPEYLNGSIEIDDECLMMVMYSEELGNVLKKCIKYTNNTTTDPEVNTINDLIASMLIRKMQESMSYNSVAQSVVDEIKRNYDECYLPSTYDVREDLTLLIRVFDDKLRDRLSECTVSSNEFLPQNDSTDSPQNSSLQDDSVVKQGQFDERGFLKPYVDFNQLHSLIESNEHCREVLNSFEKVLISLMLKEK